jgi:sugar phosphate permease
LPNLAGSLDDDGGESIVMTIDRLLRFRAAILAFLAFNATIGMIFGSFGVLLQPIAARYGASHALVTALLSVCMLVFGILAPFVGAMLHYVSLRFVMAGGAAINAVAYAFMPLAATMTQLLALFALVGVGTAMLGLVSPSVLVSRWFDVGRGRALGFVTAPIFALLAPVMLSRVLLVGGLGVAFLALGGVFALLTPAMLLIVDRPAGSRMPGAARVVAPPLLAFLKQPRFILLTIGIGLMTSAGTAFVVLTISFLMEKGLSLTAAASTFSIYALAGLVGTLLFGWVADRLGAVTALILNACMQAVLWTILILAENEVSLLALMALIGLCLPAVSTLHGASLAELFGSDNLGRVMGLSFVMKVPFLFVMAPLAGHIRDLTGSYMMSYAMLSAVLAIAAAAFTLVQIVSRAKKIPAY